MNDSGSYSVDSTLELTESQVQDSLRRDSVGDYFYEYDYYETINNTDCGGYSSFHHVHETINEDSEHHFTQTFGETRTTHHSPLTGDSAGTRWSGSLTQDDRMVDHSTRDWLDEGMLFAIFYDPEGGCQVVGSQPYTNTVHETSDSDWHYHLDATYDELEFHGDWTQDSSWSMSQTTCTDGNCTTISDSGSTSDSGETTTPVDPYLVWTWYGWYDGFGGHPQPGIFSFELAHWLATEVLEIDLGDTLATRGIEREDQRTPFTGGREPSYPTWYTGTLALPPWTGFSSGFVPPCSGFSSGSSGGGSAGSSGSGGTGGSSGGGPSPGPASVGGLGWWYFGTGPQYCGCLDSSPPADNPPNNTALVGVAGNSFNLPWSVADPLALALDQAVGVFDGEQFSEETTGTEAIEENLNDAADTVKAEPKLASDAAEEVRNLTGKVIDLDKTPRHHTFLAQAGGRARIVSGMSVFFTTTFFEPKYHEEITKEALKKDVTRVDALDYIIKANKEQDNGWNDPVTRAGPFWDPINHGDNDQIEQTIQRIKQWISDAQKILNSNNDLTSSQQAQLFKSLGKAFHAIQDLVSHSNYVELATAAGAYASPDKVPIPDFIKNRRPKDVFTGTYVYLDKNADDPKSHYQMNHDSPNSVAGSKPVPGMPGKFKMFDVARDVAIRETQSLFKFFLAGLSASGRKLWDEFAKEA